MRHAYPTSYRRGREPTFKPPAPRTPMPGTVPPAPRVPDNDNFPFPANDNKKPRRSDRARVPGSARVKMPLVGPLRTAAIVGDLVLGAVSRPEQAYDVTVPGFYFYKGCSGLPINWQSHAGQTCLALQAGGAPLGTPIPHFRPNVHLANRQPIVVGSVIVGYRWSTVEIWLRNPGNNQPSRVEEQPYLPARRRFWVRPTPYSPAFGVEPLSTPIHSPVADPHPLNRSQRRARDRRERGRTERSYRGQPLRRGRIELRPSQVPSQNVSIDVTPGGSSKSKNPGQSHHRRPARRGEKERKGTLMNYGLGRLLYRIMDTSTEAWELLEIVFDALPDEVKSKYRRRPDHMAKAIYKHADELDLNDIVQGIILNQIEDALAGRLARARQRQMLDVMRETGISDYWPGPRGMSLLRSKLGV